MSRLRADVLVAASVPMLLLAGVLPWQRDRICTVAGCGMAEATAWTGSPAWALPLLGGVTLGGLWVLLLPSRPVPTGVAALTAAVGGIGAVAVAASLDAVVFGRAGFFPFALPVVETFPVLSVGPGIGLPLGLLGLIAQAAAGWMTVRTRGALVTPWKPPGRGSRTPAAAVGLAQGPPVPRRGAGGRGVAAPTSGRRRARGASPRSHRR